jgi:hypothetical protein
LGQKPIQVQGKFPGRPTKEESEEFLAKLKLLLEGKLVQSLVNLKLLAEIKVDSSLLKLEFLLGKREIESLESLKLLVGLNMSSFLVKLELLLEEGVIGVDAKSAPRAKHTASRTSWLHTRRDHKACQSIFPEN